MPDLALIVQALDFVDDHLQEPIGVADMAATVGYSLYHFCRTFNKATHHTPYDYLMRRRLSEAAQTLLQTQARIIDVALDYQFNNPETFSRAFRRMFDVQPSQLRKLGSVDERRLMPRLTLAHLQQIGKGAYLKPVLEERSSFQVAGIMTIKQDRNSAEQLQDLLARELRTRAQAITVGSHYGITCYSEDRAEPSVLYMAAVEARELDFAGTALVVKTIPATKYACFIHKGPVSQIHLTLDYVYHTWLPKSGERQVNPWIIEQYSGHYREANLETSESRLLIPIG
jgi:AraC family transcriptional regulator